ncbi:zinc finger protein 883-like [Melitaea cinxia]|uniref:zinc finger protein 883-like n=1 Tax=Melitaea cinxia TaxID=113334 RepID=UPI001E2725C5|nr:zinc finger protein 883-like [Melitaea cinxia]
MAEIWNLNTLCRCCHADGSFSNLNSPCDVMGSNEVCSYLLNDIFGIQLHSPSIEVSHMICNKCIKHLQDGAIFKKQVMECELKFQEYCKNELLQYMNIKLEKDEEDTSFVAKTEVVMEYEDEHMAKNVISPEDEDGNLDCEGKEEIVNIEYEAQDKIRDKIKNKEEKIKIEGKPKRAPVSCKGNPDKILCKLCQTDFTDRKSLKEHNFEKHSSLKACNICNIKFNTLKSYNRHIHYHSIAEDSTIPLAKMNKFDCKICKKSYRKINKLLEHNNTHTREKIYTCDLCKKEFLKKSGLRNHILRHTGRIKQYMCETCGHPFDNVTYLNQHVITVHKKLKLFKCTLCSKVFSAKKTLKIHTRLHTGERPYECNVCDSKFTCLKNLKCHRKKHEENNESGDEFVCKFCQSVFDRRGLYLKHLRSHISAKERKCTECNKNFSNTFSLKRHIETHMTVKKFSCDKCDRKFVSAHKLKYHGRYHDTNGIKKLKTNCEICKRAVTDIEKHMKTHNDRTHPCDFCSNIYADRNVLTRHIKQVHRGVRYECDICEKKFVNIISVRKHKMKIHNLEVKTKKEE